VIREFRIQGYGCIQDAKLTLTPLHALIGPNDSGKSTTLRALAGFVNTLGYGANLPDPPKCEAAPITRLTGHFGREKESNDSLQEFFFARDKRKWRQVVRHAPGATGLVRDFETAKLDSIGRAQIVRLNADDLKAESHLLTDEQVALFPKDRGSEIAGVYDAIIGRGDDTFARITDGVRNHFGTVANVRVRGTSATTKGLGVKLTDGTLVNADQMSEGLLYYLAFAAMREVNNAKLLLIEEPENGLHPARIAEVVKMLRELSEQGTQVLIATHSPLVINELGPQEVSVVTRTPQEGTKITPIAETPHFKERSEIYALGELWLSYANGVDEAPLLQGTAREA